MPFATSAAGTTDNTMKSRTLFAIASLSLNACVDKADKPATTCAAQSPDSCDDAPDCRTLYATPLTTNDDGDLCYEDDTPLAVGCTGQATCDDAITFANVADGSSATGGDIHMFNDTCIPEEWEVSGYYDLPSPCPEGSHPGATPAHPGATPAHPGATPAHPGATPAHLGATLARLVARPSPSPPAASTIWCFPLRFVMPQVPLAPSSPSPTILWPRVW